MKVLEGEMLEDGNKESAQIREQHEMREQIIRLSEDLARADRLLTASRTELEVDWGGNGRTKEYPNNFNVVTNHLHINQ